MKFCPKCSATYSDESLSYCLNDGTPLQTAAGGHPDQRTAVMGTDTISDRPTVPNVQETQAASSGMSNPIMPTPARRSRTWIWAIAILGGAVLLCGTGIAGAIFFAGRGAKTANRSINSTPVRVASTPFAVATETPDPTPENSGLDITLAQYTKLATGMSRSDVESILGGEGTQLSSYSSDDTTYSVDQWEGKNYSFVIVSFQNDKVVSKSQAGLK